MIKSYVITNFSGLADDHSHTVVNEKVMTNGCAWVNLNSSEGTGNLRNPTCEQLKVVLPEFVGYAMRPDGM